MNKEAESRLIQVYKDVIDKLGLDHTEPVVQDRLDTRRINYASVEVEGIDMQDYPDLVDSYASYAEYIGGTALSESELDKFNDTNRDFIQEKARESLL